MLKGPNNALAKDRGSPQELEDGLRSEPYLLVIINQENLPSFIYYVFFLIVLILIRCAEKSLYQNDGFIFTNMSQWIGEIQRGSKIS